MPFPSGVTLCAVHIPEPSDHLGENATVRVTVEPSHMLVHQESGIALAKIDREVKATESGDVIIHLPHDQPGFVDKRGNEIRGWSYKVTIVIQGSGKSDMTTKTFQIPQGVDLLNPLLIIDGPPIAAIIAPTPTVTSFGGLTGAITPQQLATLIPNEPSVTPDPSNPGFYLISEYNPLTPDPSNPGLYLAGA